MKPRQKILFKINNEVILEESSETLVETIEAMKWIIVSECECCYDEIDVEIIDLHRDISMIDVDASGMFDWTSCDFKPFKGVKFNLIEGTDEYLDAVTRNDLESYLVFY